MLAQAVGRIGNPSYPNESDLKKPPLHSRRRNTCAMRRSSASNSLTLGEISNVPAARRRIFHPRNWRFSTNSTHSNVLDHRLRLFSRRKHGAQGRRQSAPRIRAGASPTFVANTQCCETHAERGGLTNQVIVVSVVGSELRPKKGITSATPGGG